MAQFIVEDDYYQRLKVSQTATFDTIKGSYRALALQLHPDKNPDKPSATQEFQKLLEAWDTLKDNGKRSLYDLRCARFRRAREEAENARKYEAQRQAELRAAQAEADKEQRQKEELRQAEYAYRARLKEWTKRQDTLEDQILQVKRKIERHEAALKTVEETEKKEQTEKQRWGFRVPLPFIRQTGPSEEETKRKEEARLQRIHHKAITESALKNDRQALKQWENDLVAGRDWVQKAKTRYYKLVEEDQARTNVNMRGASSATYDDPGLNGFFGTFFMGMFGMSYSYSSGYYANVYTQYQGQAQDDLQEASRKERERRRRKEEERVWNEDARKRDEQESRRRRNEQERQRKENEEEVGDESEIEEGEVDESGEEDPSSEEEEQPKHKQPPKPNPTLPKTTRPNHPKPTRSRGVHTPQAPRRKRNQTPNCRHRNYWDAVQRGGHCEECSLVRRRFIFQCPDCKIKACGNCRDDLRKAAL